MENQDYDLDFDNLLGFYAVAEYLAINGRHGDDDITSGSDEMEYNKFLKYVFIPQLIEKAKNFKSVFDT